MLALPRYGALGASSRLRIAQYLPYLGNAGVKVTCSELLDDVYVRSLYENRYAMKSIIYGYLNRFERLYRAKAFDVLWVEKESLPWLPALFELGMYRDVPLWLDYDDAVFHRYDQHASVAIRTVLGTKLDALMRRADLVTVGNDYLGERARLAGSRWVERVPTVVDLVQYPPASRDTRKHDEIVIGWIGSPSTANYLQFVNDAMAVLSRKHSLRCIAIGARPDQVINTPFQAVPWTEETEASLLQTLDIGIMPLPDTPWERGKCGYKLIQYMASGLPVVASPVGVNAEIVSHGENGFLAENDRAWIESLEALIADGTLRRRMGAAGRARVEHEYCSQVQAPRLMAMLRQLGAR